MLPKIDQQVVEKLKEKYKDIHPLIFHRSLERAKSAGDLFDILDTIPGDYPLMWSEEQHKWIVLDRLMPVQCPKEGETS